MANELQIRLSTGLTLYAQRTRASDGYVWSTVGSAYEAPTAANWGNYDIALTEDSTTGYYRGSDPDPGTLGGYTVFRQAGGSPATTDISVGGGALGTQPANVTQISDDATAADNLETMLDGTGGQTLSLGRLVVSSDGSAGASVLFSSTGDYPALEVVNSGVGYGLYVHAADVGFYALSTSGSAVQFQAGAGGGGHALYLLAAGGGNAVFGQASSGNGNGMRLIGSGTGTGLSANVTGSVTGNLSGSVGSVAAGGITAASLADGCITDAKISTPAEASGNPTTVLAMIRRLFEWRRNKRTRNRTTGVVTLRNAADDGNLVTYTQSTASVTDTEGASS